MLIALEMFVTNPEEKEYLRAIAWLRLVRVWSGLRSADTQGIATNRLHWSPERGLRGVLIETKTTGPGKKTLEVPFFVHAQATLAHTNWLQVGWLIWKSFDFSRDYFVPRGDAGLEKPLHKMADYPYLLGVNRHLLTLLNAPRRYRGLHGNILWESVPDGFAKLCPAPLHLMWSEHSDCHWLATVAAAAGISKELRDYVGRWGADGHQSNEYILSAQQAVSQVQEAVLRYLAGGHPGFDEEELFTLIIDRVVERALATQEVATEMMDHHRVLFQGETGMSLHQQWPPDSGFKD